MIKRHFRPQNPPYFNILGHFLYFRYIVSKRYARPVLYFTYKAPRHDLQMIPLAVFDEDERIITLRDGTILHEQDVNSVEWVHQEISEDGICRTYDSDPLDIIFTLTNGEVIQAAHHYKPQEPPCNS